MADQFKADVDILSPNDSGTRALSSIKLIVIHTNEGDPNGKASDLAAYLAKPSSQASYHIVVDRAGKTARSNDDQYVPWAAGSPANETGLHLCFIGRASQTRAEWLTNNDKQFDAASRVLAKWSADYGIPLIKITGVGMEAGRKGVGGHKDTVDAWHATDHTDPGAGFPWDVLITKASGQSGVVAQPGSTDPVVVPAGKYRSRVPGSTYVGSLEDFILNIDARLYAIAKQMGLEK